MIQEFITSNKSSKLTLFFLGYGQDPVLFTKLFSDVKSDLAIVYDYSSFDFDDSVYDSYEKIKLITWSMGVMIAPRVLAASPIRQKIYQSIAINGTLEGIDDTLGIPSAMWQATIDAMSEENALKFYRRMCANGIAYNEYLETKPKRSAVSLQTELIAIQNFAANTTISSDFSYDFALVGKKDRILSPSNQLNSWNTHSTKVVEKDISHYDKDEFVSLVTDDY